MAVFVCSGVRMTVTPPPALCLAVDRGEGRGRVPPARVWVASSPRLCRAAP
jgi:hypothetical protein